MREFTKQQYPGRHTPPIVPILLILLVAILLVITIFATYRLTSARFEKLIDQLTTELALLKEPVTVSEEVEETVDLGMIRAEMQEIGELATVEYLYTDVAQYSDPKQLFGRDVPFTTKSFIIKWDGVIKAGVDITQITVALDLRQKEITVRMPAAQILSHETILDSYETLDEKDNVFNPISIDDIRLVDAAGQTAMEQRAIENGLLDKALENAKSIISGLISGNPTMKNDYSIVFEIIEN